MTNRFLTFILISFLCTLVIIGLFNFIINPYFIFKPIHLQNINTTKPVIQKNTRLAKTYMLQRIQPKTLIIGNSRVDIGLDPESSFLPTQYKPAFNLGLPGTSIYSQYRYIQHATTKRTLPNTIILGLDFENFFTSPENIQNFIDINSNKAFEKRLNVNYSGETNIRQHKQVIKDIAISTLSNSATIDSFKTILSKKERTITKLGFSSGKLRFKSETENKGYYSTFKDVTKNYTNQLDKKLFFLEQLDKNLISPNSDKFNFLKEILDHSKENKIQLILLILPNHAFIYEIRSRYGLWNDFEIWKQEIIKLVKEFNVNNNKPTVVWDFAYYNKYTTENMPKQNDTVNKMSWFWEPIHFKKELGNLVLKSIFSVSKEKVGVKISSDNICNHLQKIRAEKKKYRKNKIEQIKLLELMISTPKTSAPDSRKNQESINCKPSG